MLGAVLFVLTLLVGPSAFADEIVGDATVSYQARVRAVVNDQGYSGRIYHRPGMQRHEFDGGAMPSVRILRSDLGIVWNLDTERRQFTEDRLADVALDVGLLHRGAIQLMEREGGTRPAAGAGLSPAKRYEFSAILPDGGPTKGELWLTRRNVLLRVTGTSRIAGQYYVYRYELSEIRFSDQPMDRFVIPEGYVRVERRPVWIRRQPGTKPVAGSEEASQANRVDGDSAAAGQAKEIRVEGREAVDAGGAARDDDPTSLESFFRRNP